MEYLPLQMIKNTTDMIAKEQGKEFEFGTAFKLERSVIVDIIKMMGMDPLKSGLPETKEEYVRALMSSDFLSDDKNARYPIFNKTCMMLAPILFESTGMTIEYFKKHPTVNMKTELRDLLLQFTLFDEWAMNKQVLKPDKTFAYYLIQTDKLRITKKMIEHLPFNNFYIDVSDSEKDNTFGNIMGMFVNVIKITDDEFALAIYNIDKSVISFSHYTHLSFDGKDELEIDTSLFNDCDKIAVAPISRTTHANMSDSAMMTKNLKIFIFQMICYISIPDADITENPQMKKTYHPNKTVKNKFREVYIRDIGIKVGAVITQRKRQVVEEYKNSKEYRSDPNKSRKLPTPHFRRAHWHHYWTGTGRTELTTKWIEPTFVCGKSSDITIHPVN